MTLYEIEKKTLQYAKAHHAQISIEDVAYSHCRRLRLANSFPVAFMKKRTVIHRNVIKLRQYNGCCNLKIFINIKMFTFVITGRCHNAYHTAYLNL